MRPDMASVLQQTKMGAAVMDGMGRTVVRGDGHRPPENESLYVRVFVCPVMGAAGAPA